jgi:transcriptional regulator with XRE-family HTH domain
VTTPAGLPVVLTALLRGAREARGWRTSELARQLHCSRRWVEQVEAGTALPSALTLELWCRELDIDRSEFAAVHQLRDIAAGRP